MFAFKLHTWDWPTLEFCGVFLRQNKTLSASDGFIKSIRFQSTQEAIKLEYFVFWWKGKMVKVTSELLDSFIEMSRNVPIFKVCVFASDFKFWIGLNEY